MKRRVTFRGAADTAEIRTATFRGAEHVVVPVVAAVGDIVWQPMGSLGPEFLPASVLAKVPGGWNGRPVVPDHPGLETANDPGTLDRMEFGQVFNARFEDKRLKFDAYLSTARAVAVGEDAEGVIERAMAGEPVEVSIGGWATVEARKGEHNGVEYVGIWRDLVPDHLAMLPEGTKGACSNETGCGAPRAAKEGGVKELLEQFLEVMGAKDALEDEDNAPASAEGDPEWVAVEAGAESSDCRCHEGRKAKTKPEGDEMSKVKELVGSLVASEASPFDETDRETLEAMPEGRLAAMLAGCEELTEARAAAAAPEPKADANSVTLTREEYARMKAATDAHEAAEKAKREAVVERIIGATDAFTAEDLADESLSKLEKIAAAVAKVESREATNYAGRGLPTGNDDAPALPDTWGLNAKEAN